MAALDPSSRHREVLPSINHLDLDKMKSERPDHFKFTGVNGLNISTAPLGSPTTIYSGPPPPYSYPSSTTVLGQTLHGYISPPESTTRRSTRDEKDSPTKQSLPSIHEALGAPLSATVQHAPGSTPSTAITQSFPEGPKGPVNPFSQPTPSFRETPFTSQPPPPNPSIPSEQHSSRNATAQHFGAPSSPRVSDLSSFRSGPLQNSTFNHHSEPPRARSPVQPSFSQFSGPPSAYGSEPFQFTAGSRYNDGRPSLARPSEPYGDTVKRHLEVFDVELGLREINEASKRTEDFSLVWIPKYQANRSGYFQDALPGLDEVDDMMRQSNRVMENLAHIRETVVAQQNAASEHRARLARGMNGIEEYADMSDEYKAGGFCAADAKKRRGKAAPPGRCHSCNRAETPEWRRGPDGARTLCNACGLHYAKLTRKMGVHKAAALTGANLRPKNLDQHV